MFRGEMIHRQWLGVTALHRHRAKVCLPPLRDYFALTAVATGSDRVIAHISKTFLVLRV